MIEKLNDYKTYLQNIKRSAVYYNYLNVLFAYLEKNNLDFTILTKEQLADYFKDYAPNSINNIIKACRDYTKFLKLDKHCAFEIKLLEIDRKLPKYITLQELERGIRDYATYNSRGMSTLKANAILKFLFFTGIRKGELLSLKREKIDLVNCAVAIWGQKDKTERIVYYPDKIVKELTDYFNSEEEQINAFNVTLSEISYLSKKIGKYLDKSLSTHTFRHSGARYMVEKNVSPLIIQRILGHASLNTTLIYTQPDDRMTADIYHKQIG